MNQAQPVAAAEIYRDATLGKSMLALNNVHAQELSRLEPEWLEQLVA